MIKYFIVNKEMTDALKKLKYFILVWGIHNTQQTTHETSKLSHNSQFAF